MKNEQVAELLYQALETEKGGIQVYEAHSSASSMSTSRRSGRNTSSKLATTSASSSK